jgi:hypothetical protein
VATCIAYATDGEGPSGSDITLECDSFSGRDVTLDGSGSLDPDDTDAVLSFHWEVAGVMLDDPDAATTAGVFPIGVTMATLTVTDALGGFGTCDVIVRVQDGSLPQVMVTTSEAFLWPPNHAMKTVEVIITATDECQEPESMLLTSVMLHSNELDDAAGDGDGDTTGDSHGADGFTDAVDITGEFVWDDAREAWVATIQLRAERIGSGSGRAYVIDATASDANGNFGTSSCVIVCPRSQGGGG